MSESSRSDSAPAQPASTSSTSSQGHDRDAKIEQLLLVGLDHYFATQYQEAINVWTRALFLDRSHPRARAYIERARSAMSERQRQSDEARRLAGLAADRVVAGAAGAQRRAAGRARNDARAAAAR